MCLFLENNQKARIAKEDIICYKRIRTITGYDKKYHGLRYTGFIDVSDINGYLPIEGKISIDESNGILYFCHNNKKCSGAFVKNKFDYKYSWEHDMACHNITIENDLDLKPDCIYVTPYRDTIINIGETYKSKLRKFITPIGYTIEEGLHSFTRVEDAYNDGCGIIVKCIIPKGSKYYKGVFGYESVPSYASDCITYVEIVNMGSYVNLI